MAEGIDYRRMLPLMFAVFVNIAGFSLILPLLPFYGPLFGAGPFEVALLFAAYSLGNVFGEIFWGRQSDKHGRRAVLILTTAGRGADLCRLRLCAGPVAGHRASASSMASSAAR